MTEIKRVPIVAVNTKDGSATDAAQLLCPDCNGGAFYIYVHGGHLHLVCTSAGCESQFCQKGAVCAARVARG